MTLLLHGRPIAASLESRCLQRSRLLSRQGTRPCVAVLLIGGDAPSEVYGSMIARACRRVEIECRRVTLDPAATLDEACGFVEALNRDPEVHGILVKRPLPGVLADETVLQCILPGKDVDGVHHENVGRLVVEGPGRAPVPCTPAGVLALLAHHDIALRGLHAVVVGRSRTVGRPLANLLALKGAGFDATVTICHKHSRDLSTLTRHADLLISAVGVPRLIGREWVSPDAVVVDVGTNAVPDTSARRGYRLVGDVDFEALNGHCRALTPVPGGVGPVTVAMLLSNLLDAAESA